MTKDDELKIELAKNKADEFVIKKELEAEKNKFIANLVENGLGNEIKNANTYNLNIPVKFRKPFKIKFKEFLNNIKKVFGL